ncbi:ATP-binding cassette domain-containing protein [Nostocoides sp. F2B08]|uniref:ABC transporter ATP-binding protein n=1 Tax=Nostocoides sp. F2B08 TaxID=2653936 RepID=UPI001262DBD0|nr:ABC transporter ATP-binding protein [Tetrasphaera sp. F2B08]KAB7744187.1 ATP-binding cassette domain-containing protein [Tetrasphaera sp. F2B08]
MNAIEARSLGKDYAAVRAVDAIDLDVPRGQVTAVLGPNGAGKTTTIEMLLGLRRPTRGSVRVLGGDPQSRAVRSRVGAMLQDTDAPESLTVREIIDLVAAYYPARLRTEDVLARADLGPSADRRVTQLSGGQRQRLSFALAIAGDPDLLFLDEPTAALDVTARREFWHQVSGFASLGKTILFSTHNLAEADEFAERVVVIASGAIVADGPPARIKQLVPGRTLTLRTDAPEPWLRSLPDVRDVAALDQPPSDRSPGGINVVAGTRALRLQVVSAETVLRELFAAGHEVADLTVAEGSLEDAFVHLTGRDAAPAEEPLTTDRLEARL